MLNYATVGASLLIKAMLCRQSLLTNNGQAGFIITCSTTILSSLNKVLQDKIVFFQKHKEKATQHQQMLKEFLRAIKKCEVEEVTWNALQTAYKTKLNTVSFWGGVRGRETCSFNKSIL